ncbi:MAG: ABC transporter permease [Marmoricola sp.]
MSAVTMERVTGQTAGTSAEPSGIPLTRIVGVEFRKMFNTRSGFWLMASIAITAVLATGAVITWAPADALTYDTFAAAIGFPMSVILPMVAILLVTSEWSQRSGLTTFTLVPHRGRVIGAKATATVIVGVASMVVALAIGALGNILGTAITGTPRVWDDSFLHLSEIVLANVLGMMIGFMLGVLIRNSAGAIVGYFVFTLVLPTLSGILAANASWWEKAQGWVDFNYAQSALFNGEVAAKDWAHLASASGIWLVLPLTVGLVLVMRSEVK